MPSLVLSIISLHWLGILMPGPDFALILRNSTIFSRKNGLATALGLSLGMACLAILAAFLLPYGLHFLPQLYLGIKYFGAGYLFYLSYKIFSSIHKNDELATFENLNNNPRGFSKDFWEGLFCTLLNPKVLVFFIAIFTSMAQQIDPSWKIIIILEFIFATFLWFGGLSILLTSRYSKKIFNKIGNFQRNVSVCTGCFFILFGLLILFKT